MAVEFVVVRYSQPPEWPGEASAIGLLRRGTEVELIELFGDRSVVRPWASVSKVVVALAAAIEVAEGHYSYSQPLGPAGATVAHLLSHSSGLGLEATDRVIGVGEQRVYSNYGIDVVAESFSTSGHEAWTSSRVFAPLGLRAKFVGRAAAGAEGSTEDLAHLARELLAPTLLDEQDVTSLRTPFLPALDGIVPGFGRFRPCPWGLGVEVRGEKDHWMGARSPESFGHFGQSGALLLVDPTVGLAVVATSSEAFGPWARDLWPRWTDEVCAELEARR